MEKSKLLGLLAIISITLLMLWIIFFSIFGTLYGTGSGVNITGMFPFLSISILKLLILIFLFYLSLKILKGRVLSVKESGTLSFILIGMGVVYFAYNLATVLYNNITGLNPGGEMRPVLAFLWGLIFVVFGIALLKKKE